MYPPLKKIIRRDQNLQARILGREINRIKVPQRGVRSLTIRAVKIIKTIAEKTVRKEDIREGMTIQEMLVE